MVSRDSFYLKNSHRFDINFNQRYREIYQLVQQKFLLPSISDREILTDQEIEAWTDLRGPFVLIPYFKGISLNKILNDLREGKIRLTTTVKKILSGIVEFLISVISKLHRCLIVHGKINPSKIIYNPVRDETVFLLSRESFLYEKEVFRVAKMNDKTMLQKTILELLDPFETGQAFTGGGPEDQDIYQWAKT